MTRPLETDAEILGLTAERDRLRKALEKAIKALEYCAVDPRELHPLNNSQHTAASNAIPELREALKE